MPPAPLVELDRVTYRQQGATLLDDVSWKLDSGARWALVGPNGCGKTTLLRLAGGYVWATSGVVRRQGAELVDLGALRRSIGWVAPDLAPQIPPRERVLETVVSGKMAQVGLKRLGPSPPTSADFEQARALLAAMRCDALVDKPFGVLSHGERQQTLVARARMVDPLLLVLDEPCAGMDPGVRERFLAWLQEFVAGGAAPGAAVVFVTHHVEEIMPAFNQALLMDAGRIIAAGAAGDVLTPHRLSAAYGVGVSQLVRHAGRRWPLWSS
ncbi:MAG TPA: ATP-binding cassette domain-containing protein [Lacipirellulaceae bacterium]|nr:ATP-binding cassette domain-containing protein [Lacipirellulaceae bacterium]